METFNSLQRKRRRSKFEAVQSELVNAVKWFIYIEDYGRF